MSVEVEIERSVSGPIAEIDRALDPWSIDRKLRGVSIDQIVSVFQEAESLGKRAWIAMAICCGVAQERAGRGDRILEKLAKSFSYDRSRIVRLARAYREVIKPRLEAQGANAQFPLVERGWYETAAENAKRLGIDPLVLLEDAETKAVDNPAFTQRRWRSELGLTQTRGGIGAALKTISELDESSLDDFCQESENVELLKSVERLIHEYMGWRNRKDAAKN